MKNFALLLSSLTIASSAFATAPEVSKAIKKVSGSHLEPVSVSFTKHSNGKVLTEKSLVKDSKVMTKAPKKAQSLSVSYEEPKGLFSLGFSEDGSLGIIGASYRKGPAYTPLTWYNTSVGATEFEWEVMEDFKSGVPTIYKTQDLTHSEIYSMVDAPVLYGMDAEGNVDVFQFGAEKISDTELDKAKVGYFYGGDTSIEDGMPPLGISTYMYGQNGTDKFIGVGCMAYSKSEPDMNPVTGLDPIFTDQDGFGFVNPKFLGYGNFFPTPAAPYFITKIWTWMAVTPKKATVIEMTLYKVDEEGNVTDEIVAQGSYEMDPQNPSQWLVFDLYAVDEDGLQTDDVIVIDSGVFAQMTFNVDDIELVFPIAGNGAIFEQSAESIPYPNHAYMLVEDEGEVYFPRTPYAYYYGNSKTTLSAVTDWIWMMDAVFPWIFAVDDKTTMQAPVDGGTVSFNVSSYYSLQYFNYYITDYLNGECDWIDFEKASLSVNEDLQCEVLNLPVAALPAGVAGRSAIIEIEGPAASLKLYVHQGESTGVEVVEIDKNAEYFDLAGRRIANPEKGIYIKKTGNRAEKVLF